MKARVVHPSMSPKGVEHPRGNQSAPERRIVHPSMSPKGVEHDMIYNIDPTDTPVHPSMSPKGVEHDVNGSPEYVLTWSASINVAERR